MNTNTENLKVFFYTDSIVKEDTSLKDISKLIFSDIAYFQYLRDGKCTASNPHFAKKYGKSNGTISKAISELERKGYIERYLDQYKNRTIYVRRSKFASGQKNSTALNYGMPDVPNKDSIMDKSAVRVPRISKAEIDELINNTFSNE
jgi:DNA-binding transcriptional MocR family regulator